MKIVLLFMLIVSFVYGDCPSSSFMGGTTKCKISVDDVNVTEGDSGTKTLTFTISSDDTVNKDIKIDFETSDDSATTDDDDYEGDSSTVTIADGDDSTTVSITINGDENYEDNETFGITITVNDDSDDDAEIDDGDGIGGINNDDDLVYVKDASFSESDGTVTIYIVAKDGAHKDFSIDWETEDDTADSDDYDSDSGTVDFNEGDKNKTITINLKDDDISEDAENFNIKLSTNDSGIETSNGKITINESDRLIIVGDRYSSPSVREELSPMKIYVRLIDPNEKAKNDINVHIKTSEDTASAGDDYDDVDVDLTIDAGDNNVSTDVTVNDDEDEENNEKFDIKLTCQTNGCGNVDINESDDKGSIIDNDQAPTLETGEYNDTDNYYLRDDSGDKKYKRLFCTPINIWGDGDDETNKVEVASPDDNITQIIEGEDFNISYYRLYAKQIEITSDGGDGEVCKEGTHKCETENLTRLGDEMDVNKSWFDKDKIGDYVEKEVPKCESGKSIDIYNVDEDGKQIWWAKGDEWADCTVNFKIRDENYSKPFLIEYVKTYDNDTDGGDLSKYTTFNVAPGIYFWKKVKYDGKIFLHVKDDEYSDAPYKIARMYFGETEHGGDNGYVFAQYSHINYEDCDGDDDIDKDDAPCQEPSKFMYWFGGLEDDSMIIAIEKEEYFAGYFYDAVAKRGTDNDDVNIKFARDVGGAFVGGVSAWWIRLDPESEQLIYWKKPDPDMRYFLGDGDKCIYTPSTHVEAQNQKLYESDEENADINVSVEYFTPGTRQAFCRNDWKIKFDWEIKEHGSAHGDSDGNATEDVDYSKDTYSGNMVFERSSDDCDEESSWPPLSQLIDFSVKYDDRNEIDELFDFNLSNPENTKFEDTDDEYFLYYMTIVDSSQPETIQGLFDSYDVSRSDKENDNSGKIGDDEDEDRNTSVQISSKQFSLTLASFDSADKDSLKKTDSDVKVKYKLIYCPDENTSDATDCSNLTDLSTFNSDKYTEEDVDFNLTQSYQNVVLMFRACTLKDDDGNYTIYNYDDGSCKENGGNCKDDNDNEQKCYRNILSTDKFTLKPQKFSLNMDSVSNLLSANNYDINITALGYKSSDKTDGNYSIDNANTVYVLSRDIFKAPDDDTIDSSLVGDVSFPESFNMDHSEANTKITFNDVGKVNIQIIDKKWAEIDEKSSPQDCSDTGTWICGEINATFIPHHFSVENAELKNNGGEVYTYITDDINNTSATLSLVIYAKNKDNDTVKNFQDGNWENNVTVSFSIPDNTDTSDINESQYVENNITNEDLDFTEGNVTIDHNNSVLSFNYERNNSKAINPFKINGSDVTTKVLSTYTDINITGSSTNDESAIFVYPKAYASRYKYVGNDGNATIYVLDYCDGDECDKTLLPDGDDSKNIDDSRWFINTKHKAKYGKVDEVKEKRKSNVSVTSLSDEDPTTRAELKLDDGVQKTYKTTMKINASKWLIYNKYDEDKEYNEFSVEFYNPKTGWAGIHETNTTTTTKGSSKFNSRIMW